MNSVLRLLAVVALVAVSPDAIAASAERASRGAVSGCRWERFSDASLGLDAWVQRCDFGFRKIGFLVKGRSLAIKYSDGGDPDPLIDMLDLQPGETTEAGIRRIFDARTDKAIARRCVLVPYSDGQPPAQGVKRYTFVPDAAYGKELAAKANPNDVPDPPCGDWGDQPDGIQYFEAQPPARRVMFVRIGQDEPLFDEKTLRILPSK